MPRFAPLWRRCDDSSRHSVRGEHMPLRHRGTRSLLLQPDFDKDGTQRHVRVEPAVHGAVLVRRVVIWHSSCRCVLVWNYTALTATSPARPGDTLAHASPIEALSFNRSSPACRVAMDTRA